MLATPVGNLADISLRALYVLELADSVACEDTRHGQTLLRAYGIDKAPRQLLAAHQHNEAQVATDVIERLRQGQRVVLVSDAGTPAVSDPGGRLVSAVRAAGLAVIPIPGVSSITAAISVAGINDERGFVFVGFGPSKTQERAAAVAVWGAESRAQILLEAPHRITALAQALAVLGSRPLTVARELTKQFEEIATLPAQDLSAWLAAQPQRERGEFVLVLHPQTIAHSAEDDSRVLGLLLAQLPLKTAVALAAQITGASRNVLYARALSLKSGAAD